MEPRERSPRDEEGSSIEERLNKLAEDIRSLPRDRIDELEKVVCSMGKRALSVREAAEVLGVSIETIRRAIKSGALKAFQINKAGNWKIPTDEIDRFMRGEKQ